VGILHWLAPYGSSEDDNNNDDEDEPDIYGPHSLYVYVVSVCSSRRRCWLSVAGF